MIIQRGLLADSFIYQMTKHIVVNTLPEIIKKPTVRVSRIALNDSRTGSPMAHFIKTYFDATDQVRMIRQLDDVNDVNNLKGLILEPRLNKTGNVNEWLKRLNVVLPVGGIMIGHARTPTFTKSMLRSKYRHPLNRLAYFHAFVLHRVLPKLSAQTARLHKNIFTSRELEFSKAEILGRIVYAGFEILDYVENEGELHFAVRKIQPPTSAKKASYWPVFKMERIGVGGQRIGVFKLRTMHPYSEFLQTHIKEKHGLDSNGKFRNDFRITSWGKWLRRYWIDELPMIINLLKGDLKIVGVRPISEQYYNMYPEDVKMLRRKFKPGLIPPYYADMPGDFEAIVASERKYLQLCEKGTLLTDLRYLARILTNILFRSARSK